MPIDPKDIVRTYEQHKDALRRFFRSAAPRNGRADDLVQDVYTALLEYAPDETLRDPAAYLYKVAWHVLQRSKVNARQEPETFDHDTLEEMSHGWADSAEMELAAEQQLVQVMKQLPALHGAVVLLNRRDGMNYSQIAQRLDLSVPQVRRYLGHALAHIKKALRNDYE